MQGPFLLVLMQLELLCTLCSHLLYCYNSGHITPLWRSYCTYYADIECIYSDYNDDKLIFRIRLINSLKKITNKQKSLDQSDEIYKLKTFQDHLLNKMVLRGVKNINRVIPRKIMNSVKQEEGKFIKKDIWVLDTVGTNLLDILNLDYIDVNRTYTNDIILLKSLIISTIFSSSFRVIQDTVFQY